MEDQIRDSRGRFVRGHTSITLRDLKTGRFTSKEQTNPSMDTYENVKSQIDSLLEEKGISMEQALKRWRSEFKEKI
ncbi:MAG: hypothetical protein KAJ44_01660 [Thermoplasmatales archaeon]|nr:hypothetical protein [Thermoplasmatales archaeon]